MSIYVLSGLAAVAASVVATQRRYGLRRLLVMIAAIAAAALGLLAASHWSVRVGPPRIGDFVAILGEGACVVLLTPLGDMLLARLEAVVDPGTAFDRQLHAAFARYSGEVRRLPAPGEASEGQRRTVLETGAAAVQALRLLGPPDAQWSALRDDYVAWITDDLEAFEFGTSPERAAELKRQHADVTARAERLRARHRRGR